MKNTADNPYRSEDLQAWLDEKVMPKSAIGRRMAAPSWFRPGEEDAAQEEIRRVAAGSQRFFKQLDAINLIFADLLDPSEALLKIGGGAPDLVDVQQVFRFVDGVNELYAAYFALGSESMALPESPEAFLPALSDVRDLLAPGNTRTGFTLAGIFPDIFSEAEHSYRAAEKTYEQARAVAAKTIEEAGIALPKSEKLVADRDTYAALSAMPAFALLRVVQEVANTVVLEPRMTDDMIVAQRAMNDALVHLQEQQIDALRRLAERIRRALPAFEAALTWIARFDEYWQRLCFAATYSGCVPQFATSPEMRVQDAVFLPLAQRLGAGYTPISFVVAPLAVVTGSNMGGKSAALATAAFIALLARSGLPVPAKSAKLALVDEIITMQSRESAREGLSDFAEEMLRLREVVCAPPARRCVAIDEFARTTNINEGRALLIAVIRRLVRRGDMVMVATHIDGVAAALGIRQYRVAGLQTAVPAAEGDDLAGIVFRLAKAFDRRLVEEDPGRPPSSDAFAVARAFGIPADIMEDAQREWSR